MNIYFVDIQRIFNESTPGAEARKHLAEVRAILKKGLDDVAELHKNNPGTPQAQNSIAQARQALMRQMDAEQQAADKAVRDLIASAISSWKDAQGGKVDMIVSRQTLIFGSPDFDITSEVMERVNGMSPKFAPLPKVTINKKQ